MTSKEAMQNIEKQATVKFSKGNKYIGEYCVFVEELEAIKKDLEILQIIKNYIVCDDKYGVCVIDQSFAFDTHPDEYRKIKRWLKNAK